MLNLKVECEGLIDPLRYSEFSIQNSALLRSLSAFYKSKTVTLGESANGSEADLRHLAFDLAAGQARSADQRREASTCRWFDGDRASALAQHAMRFRERAGARGSPAVCRARD